MGILHVCRQGCPSVPASTTVVPVLMGLVSAGRAFQMLEEVLPESEAFAGRRFNP